MATATSGKLGEKGFEHVCPICRTDMKLLPRAFKFDYEIEGMKKYTTRESVYVCPSCGLPTQCERTSLTRKSSLPPIRPFIGSLLRR